MKKLILLVLVLLPAGIWAQSLNDRFLEYMQQEKYDVAGEVLAEWEASDGRSPEFLIAAFNYYYRTARQNLVTLGQDPAGEALAFYDTGDEEHQSPAGYIYENVYFDGTLLAESIAYIDRGIAEYPDRLDMLFGKTYALMEAEMYDDVVETLVAAVECSAKIGNAWRWSGNEPLENGTEFFFSNLQHYVAELYETEDAVDYMEAVASAVLKYYPDNIVNINNMGIVSVLRGDVDTAIGYYLRAHALSSEDCVVLSNLVMLYKEKGMIDEARKYLEKIMDTGDPDYKRWAEGYIASLPEE